jgi:DNA-binding NtrC family response regulator
MAIRCRASEDMLDALAGYRWPGNVREPQNVSERTVIMTPAAVTGCRPLSNNFVTGPPHLAPHGVLPILPRV